MNDDRIQNGYLECLMVFLFLLFFFQEIHIGLLESIEVTPLHLIKGAYECSGNHCDSFRYYSFNYEFKKQAIFSFFFISTFIKLLVPK
jgi:hypothetical protein